MGRGAAEFKPAGTPAVAASLQGHVGGRSPAVVPATAQGTLDLRRMLQGMARQPHTLSPAFTQPRRELPPLVVLIDISGSMKLHTSDYLKAAHTVVQNAERAEIFTLGTRLTRITSCLKVRDRERALARAQDEATAARGELDQRETTEIAFEARDDIDEFVAGLLVGQVGDLGELRCFARHGALA